MINALRKIIESSNINEEKKLNILTFPTHERYETQLCKTGHNFYAFSGSGEKKWNETYSSIPENYIIMPENSVLSYIDFDLILAQSRWSQFQLGQRIRQALKIPMIVLEHTVPTPDIIENGTADKMKQMHGDVNIFISEYSRREWGILYNSAVILHSIDSELFRNQGGVRENKILTVANDFVNRDYCLNFKGWNRVTEDFETTLIGDTPGISNPAKNVQDLVDQYNKHSVFLNTSTHSPIPKSMLEAMSCGCAVVSTATCMIPEVIEHGVDGFITNDEQEMKEHLKYLLENPQQAKEMGSRARKKIQEKFNEESFINNWNNIFKATRSLI